jgi:hypothetical protein
MHEINEKRERLCEYHRLYVQLQLHADCFLKYIRMSRAFFEEIHDLLRLSIVKYTTNWRRPFETREGLAFCLRLSSFSILYYSSFQRIYKNYM